MSKRDRRCRAGDPDSIFLSEVLNAIGQRLCHDHTESCTALALILAELCWPCGAKCLGVLHFPQDRTDRCSNRVTDLMCDVAAALADPNRFDAVPHELPAEQVFQVGFQRLALSLLRPLLGPAVCNL